MPWVIIDEGPLFGQEGYHLVICYITMEIAFFNGKTHCKWTCSMDFGSGKMALIWVKMWISYGLPSGKRVQIALEAHHF